VELNFEVNPNKYAIKDYLKSFAYDGVNVLHYNAITGIIGSNSSGKTSTLEIIEQYAKYLQSGISPFGTGANADFDARNHHERHRPATMPTPKQPFSECVAGRRQKSSASAIRNQYLNC
jgi:predicted ATPase